jgi:hypothetical protein
LLLKPAGGKILKNVVSVAALDTLVFVQSSQEIASVPIDSWVAELPDIKVVQRDISGTILPHDFTISKVQGVLTGDGINEESPLTAEFFYNEPVNQYSGFMYFPFTAGVRNYSVYVQVFDSLGRKVGQSRTIAFNSNAGNIQLPALDPTNAIPQAFAGNDTLLSINDSLRLAGSAVDSFGGHITKWEWAMGRNSNFVEATSGDTTIVLPSSPDSTYPVILRVTDDDGNTANDTMIVNVVLGTPVVGIQADDSVKVGVPIQLTSDVSIEFGEIVMYKWDPGLGEGWTDSSASLTFIAFTYEKQGTYTIRHYVRDDDGNVDTSSFIIAVWNDNPVVTMGLRDTTIRVGSTLTHSVTATDPEGIGRYLWDLNGDGIFTDTVLTGTATHTYPGTPGVVHTVVRIEDGFDGFTLDTAVVTVIQDIPVASILGPDSAKVGTHATLNAQVESQFGQIVMYKWDSGLGEGWTDSSETLESVSFTYAARGTYPVRLYVRDDIGNIDSTSFALKIWNDNPVIISGLRDTTVSINDTVFFTIQASDPEGILSQFAWEFEGLLDTTTENSHIFVMPSSPGIVPVVVTVRDNFDGYTRDTAFVNVTTPFPTNWVERTSPISTTLPSVTWADSQFVAVSTNGSVITSPDGEAWEQQESGNSVRLWSVTWTGSQLVAVGGEGTIITSTDGRVWESQTSGTSVELAYVTWINNRMVAVGGSGTVLMSTDGENWTNNSTGASSILTSAIWTGNEYLVAGTNNVIRTSTDGVNWATINLRPSGHVASLVRAGSNYLAFYTGTGGVFRSQNVSTWDNLGNILGSSILSFHDQEVIFAGGTLVATGGGGRIAYSLDIGSSWTQVNVRPSGSLWSAAWNGSRFVVVGDGGAIVTSQ